MTKEGQTPQRPQYDARQFAIPGREVLRHNSTESIVRALVSEKPSTRIFSFFSLSQDGTHYTQTVSFVDSREPKTVHRFAIDLYRDSPLEEIFEPVWETIGAQEYPRADGEVRVDLKTGAIHQVYDTDSPNKPENVARVVNAWTEDVQKILEAEGYREMEKEFLYVQMTQISDKEAVVFRCGDIHMALGIPPSEQYNKDYIRAQFPTVPLRDVTEQLRWPEAN